MPQQEALEADPPSDEESLPEDPGESEVEEWPIDDDEIPPDVCQHQIPQPCVAMLSTTLGQHTLPLIAAGSGL